MHSRLSFFIFITVVLLLVSGYFLFQSVKPTQKKPALFSSSKTSIEGIVKGKGTDRFDIEYTTSVKKYTFTVFVEKTTSFSYSSSPIAEKNHSPSFADLQIGQTVTVTSTESLGSLKGGHFIAKNITLPSLYLHIQGRIHKIALPTLFVTIEAPFDDNSSVSHQREYMVVVDATKTISSKKILLQPSGPVTEKKEIKTTEIPVGAAIDCVIKITNVNGTIGTLVYGEITQI